MTTSSSTHAIDQVIQSRHSVRAFLDQPVHVNMIKEILAVAARAPSGTNTQPWKVYVVTEQKRQDIVKQVCDAQKEINTHPSRSADHQETFAYYPQTWKSPYIDRRRQNGWALYRLLNIQRGEKDKMAAQQLRNFKFFDAPVGLFFTVDQSMGIGAKMDIAMFMQNIMLAAKARGLDTCPQAAWNHFHSIILPLLGADEDEELVCGMALGYADPKAQVNQLETPREAVEDFAHFLAK